MISNQNSILKNANLTEPKYTHTTEKWKERFSVKHKEERRITVKGSDSNEKMSSSKLGNLSISCTECINIKVKMSENGVSCTENLYD